MSCDLLEHLETHSLDPCNMFLGLNPSSSLLPFLSPFKKFSLLSSSLSISSPSFSSSPMSIINTPPASYFPSPSPPSRLYYRSSRRSPSPSSLPSSLSPSPSSPAPLSPLPSSSSSSPLSPKQREETETNEEEEELGIEHYIRRWNALKHHPSKIEEEIKNLVENLKNERSGCLVGDYVAIKRDCFPEFVRGGFTNSVWETFDDNFLVLGRIASSVKKNSHFMKVVSFYSFFSSFFLVLFWTFLGTVVQFVQEFQLNFKNDLILK